MEVWMDRIVGPHGALVLLVLVGIYIVKYLKENIIKHELKAEKQEKRLDEMHTSTIQHISANTNALERLSGKLTKCPARV